jgi:proteic killer suppression protein
MIKSFLHKGLGVFFTTGSKSGIQPHHAPRLSRMLAILNVATAPQDMDMPGWRLHPLSNGHWSVWVNGNWRLTFRFDGEDAALVDYRDYH